MKRKLKAYFYIVIVSIFWGLSFLSIKISLETIPPMTLGLIRFVMAFFVLAAMKKVMSPNERLSIKDMPYAAGAGLIGVSLYFFMENNGVLRISASESSIIIGAIPIMSMFAERIFLKTKLGLRQYIGAVISTLGVWVIVSTNLQISGSITGYLFMFGAALSWVLYSFLTKPLFKTHTHIGITFYQTIFGVIGFIPFALFEAPAWIMPTSITWLHISYLALFCSAIGYYMYVSALKDLGIGISSVFINLIPIITVAAEFVFFQKLLSPIQLLGGAAVVAGVFIVSIESPKREVLA